MTLLAILYKVLRVRCSLTGNTYWKTYNSNPLLHRVHIARLKPPFPAVRFLKIAEKCLKSDEIGAYSCEGRLHRVYYQRHNRWCGADACEIFSMLNKYLDLSVTHNLTAWNVLTGNYTGDDLQSLKEQNNEPGERSAENISLQKSLLSVTPTTKRILVLQIAHVHTKEDICCYACSYITSSLKTHIWLTSIWHL